MEVSILLTILVLCGSTYVATHNVNIIDTTKHMDSALSNDIQQATMMYKKVKHEEEVLANLKDSLRGELRAKNSLLLAETLCAGASPATEQRLSYQIDMFFEFYETQLIADILRDGIEGARSCKTSAQLVDLLWSLCREGDLDSFELMLQAQLTLFQAIAKGPHMDVDMKLQRKMAFNLYKIKQASLYHIIDVSLKQQIDQVISQLPTNLQYLLFYPYFCLMNSEYSEYIYTSVAGKNIDSTSRYIWGWHDKLSIDDTGHISANTFESNNDNSTELLVQLKGVKYEVFYYRMPETKLVAGWDLTSEPINSIWNIEFVDSDRVVLSQDDYIMCSTDELYNPQRRLVRAYKRGSYTSKSGECQWLLGTCNRKAKK